MDLGEHSGAQGSDEELIAVVKAFWESKGRSIERAKAAGLDGFGSQARDSRHMVSLTDYIVQMFYAAGLPRGCVLTGKVVPGYFRRSKNWDVVAMYKGHVVAMIELKSQAGSEGNNANNRIEEATGNALDVAVAQEVNEAFGEIPPWLGYAFVLGTTADTERVIGMKGTPIYRTDPAFDDLTYNKQYQIAIARWVSRRLYDAGWMLCTSVDAEGTATYFEPIATATAATFSGLLKARVEYVMKVVDG